MVGKKNCNSRCSLSLYSKGIGDPHLVKTNLECPLGGRINIAIAFFTTRPVSQRDKTAPAMAKLDDPSICLNGGFDYGFHYIVLGIEVLQFG